MDKENCKMRPTMDSARDWRKTNLFCWWTGMNDKNNHKEGKICGLLFYAPCRSLTSPRNCIISWDWHDRFLGKQEKTTRFYTKGFFFWGSSLRIEAISRDKLAKPTLKEESISVPDTGNRELGGDGWGTIMRPDIRGRGGTKILVRLVMVSCRSMLRA